MSQRLRPTHPRTRATWAACAAYAAGLLAASMGGSVAAQTIADYSRAQRAVLESAMVQAAARSAAWPASAAAAAAAASASAPAAALPPPAAAVAPRPLPVRDPELQVSGVFASASQTVAELLVDGHAYLLSAGQGVPGTSWSVAVIAVDRVVLQRPQAALSGGEAAHLRKSFTLPALSATPAVRTRPAMASLPAFPAAPASPVQPASQMEPAPLAKPEQPALPTQHARSAPPAPPAPPALGALGALGAPQAAADPPEPSEPPDQR